MAKLILCRGIQGSGKSTFAKEWVRADPQHRVRVNRDGLRHALYATDDTLLSPEQERFVSVVEKQIARAALAEGKDVIVDAMNLRARWVREWFTVGPVTFRDFPVTLDAALEANAGRPNPLPEDVIRRTFDRLTINGVLPPAPIQHLPRVGVDV